MNQLFDIINPSKKREPILLSVPHAGTEFPPEIMSSLHQESFDSPEDTDWFVDQLYDFSSDLGVTLIKANYSRYVVDLNRSSEGKLYQDNRNETGIVPRQTFNEKSIYLKNSEPDTEEIARRIKLYYRPYHTEVDHLLTDLKKEFKNVLLFDAHSIKRSVPRIQQCPFPDMILGDNLGTSAHQKLSQTALSCLKKSPFSYAHNHPFKGGYITRKFGRPEANRHALQLEMSQEVYMSEEKNEFQKNYNTDLEPFLKTLFEQLIETLKELNS